MVAPDSPQAGGRPIRVMIAGAGIGGIVAASALRQAGMDVVVAEKAGDLRHVQVGNGIHLANNGLLALRQLGLAERVTEGGAVLERVEWCTDRGKVLAVGDMAALERELGVPTIGIARSDLHRALAGALEDGPVRLGAAISGFEQDDSGVIVRFVDDTEERCDVLVGADGYRSLVREALVGDDGKPYFVGLVIAQATVKDWDSPPLMRLHFGQGRLFGFHPVKGGTYWYMIYRAPEGGITPDDGLKPEVLKMAERFADPAQALIDATPESDLSQTNVLASRPRAQWGHGRVTLLGDSAHAMTPFGGQGTSQAIEDAVVLMKRLRDEPDVVAALSSYEQERTAHTKPVIKSSVFAARMARLSSPVTCAVRNRVIKLIHPRVIWKEHSSTVSHTV